jgi:hypothetical protein
VCADTDDEALAATRTAHGNWYRSITKLWHDHDDHTPDGLFSWEISTQHETILFGSPARVREQMARLLDVGGCNYVIGAFAWGSLPHEHATRRGEMLDCVQYSPMDFNPTTRIAYIEASDGVSIELVHRKKQVGVGGELR